MVGFDKCSVRTDDHYLREFPDREFSDVSAVAQLDALRRGAERTLATWAAEDAKRGEAVTYCTYVTFGAHCHSPGHPRLDGLCAEHWKSRKARLDHKAAERAALDAEAERLLSGSRAGQPLPRGSCPRCRVPGRSLRFCANCGAERRPWWRRTAAGLRERWSMFDGRAWGLRLLAGTLLAVFMTLCRAAYLCPAGSETAFWVGLLTFVAGLAFVVATCADVGLSLGFSKLPTRP